MQATAKDMRFHAGALLDTAARGEEVTITYRGTPKAKLVPVDTALSANTNEAFGMWKDRKDISNPAAYVRELRRGRF